jgi:hypothetical protein
MASSLQNRGIVFSATISQDFDINYALNLNEFSTEFATAYDAKPRTPQKERIEYYALVFNKSFPVDLDKINTYRSIKEKSLQELVDFGRVQTNKGAEALCCILKRPSGKKFSEILNNSSGLDENFVTGHLFNQLFTAISIMHSNGIMHGSINLDSVYYNPIDGNMQLRECFSSFVGFYQKKLYETYERMVCHKSGKSHRELSADYYALGVFMVSLISGKEPFSAFPEELMIKIKFENGSYDSLLGIISAAEKININIKNETLLRGILHDKTKERWTQKQITGWQRKEITQPPPSRVHRQASIPFMFGDTDYFSPKYLAHTLHTNWAIAKKNLRISELTRWISATSRLPDIEKRLFQMTRGGQTEIILPDEKIARIIYLLDEDGPIRYRDTSFHPDGLGNLFSYYLMGNDTTGLEYIATCIDFGFIEGWVSTQEDQDMYKTNVMGWNSKKVKAFMRKNELGFGLERCLYELNPYLPCLSPLLETNYSVGLPAVLSALNQGKITGKNIDDDKHLTAYICFQIDIEDSIKVKQLQSFTFFAKALPIKLCAMFAFAQKASGLESLPTIANWVRQNLNSIIEKINSKKIKSKLIEDLDFATKSGDISKIFGVISDLKTVKKDVNGFQGAKKTYKVLTFEIMKLKSQRSLDQMAYRLGLRISVIVAYLICAVSILSLMFSTI